MLNTYECEIVWLFRYSLRIQGKTASLLTASKNTMVGETFSGIQQENVKLYTSVTQKGRKESYRKL